MTGRVVTAAVAAAALTMLAAAPASGALHLSQVGRFSAPTYVTAPPGDPNRVMVVEQSGRIWDIRDGTTLPAPFLDIHALVQSGGEKGLLSMAFAPDYATSGRFYVYYTAPRPGDTSGDIIRIVEYRRAAGDLDAADPGSARLVLQIDHPGQPNHNGGQLQFGPDGMLYAGTGDGGGANDQGTGRPPNNAQNLSSNLGKILRIDPISGGSSIWAYGLRNPWRFSFDRSTSDLVIADVGQSQQEEVDFARAGTGAGVNYGWVCWEGTRKNTDASPPCDAPGSVFPVLTKNHTSDGFCAIVGGYVVRDPTLGPLTGRYVYGDNCASSIRSVALAAGSASGDAPTGLAVPGLTSFGEDSCGHVYAASGNGAVYRVDGDTFTPCAPGATLPGGSGLAGVKPPVVTLGARKVQRALRQHGLRVAAACNEACAATLSGRMRIAGSKRVYALKRVTKLLAPGRRAKVTLRLSSAARTALRRALGRRRKVSARVTLVGRNAAGGQGRASRIIRVKG